jgi:hypothetical protein
VLTIPITTTGFRSLPARLVLASSWPALVRHAVTLGRPGWPEVRRHGIYSVHEMLWRASMLFANFWQPTPRGPIERSSAFQALDAAEKGAVNYFLGGIAAKLAAEGLFGVAWLVHLDQVLRAHGILVRGSRPDFLGTDMCGRQLAVEAKGHTILNPKTVAAAKRQAADLRPLPGGGPHLVYAQIAHFRRGAWRFHLDDPPPEDDENQRERQWDLGSSLAVYYQPVFEVLQQRPTEPHEVGDAVYAVASLPEVDLWLGLDQLILRALAAVVEEPSRDEPLLARLTERAERAHAESNRLMGRERQGFVWQSIRAAEEAETRRSIGVDGVLVELGSGWSDDQLTRQPEDRLPAD